jgi:hypothetical protein
MIEFMIEAFEIAATCSTGTATPKARRKLFLSFAMSMLAMAASIGDAVLTMLGIVTMSSCGEFSHGGVKLQCVLDAIEPR